MNMKSIKKDWLPNLIRDWSPISPSNGRGSPRGSPSGSPTGIPKKSNNCIPVAYKLTGFMFAVIGMIGTMKWFLSIFVGFDSAVTSQAPASNLNPELLPDQACTESGIDCPWGHVFSDMTNRLQLLELAFKEQVFARETIAREISNQSDVYEVLESKMTLFLEKLDNMSAEFNKLDKKLKDLSARVYSDETLVTVFVVALVLIYLAASFRVSIQALLNKVAVYKPNFAKIITERRVLLQRKNSSNPGTPKHSPARNEVCLIFFQRDCSSSIFLNLSEAMLRHLEGVKVAVKPYYSVFSIEDICNMPHVRLYVIIVDLETRGAFLNGTEKDLIMMTIKHAKSLGQTVVIVANDDGSKKLMAHSLYNTSLRLVKTSTCLQELAANGRLFSMWEEMTSHQLSHLRRLIKTVLNLKFILK